MNLCDHGHEEVCFEGRHCPMCSLVEAYEDNVESLKKEIEVVSKELETKTTEYDELFDEVKRSYPEFAI
jgi:hypothetical protein